MRRNNLVGPAAALLAALALVGACDDEGGTETDADTETGADTDAEAPVDLEVPDEPDALHEWVLGDEYRAWPSWSSVEPTGGLGGARVYLSPALYDSLMSGAEQHPVGAAAVRELYGEDLETITGYAVVTRVDEDASADAWLWFEVFSPEPDATPATAERAAPGCVGCHQQAVDFIQSALPLP